MHDQKICVAVYHRSANTEWPDDIGDDPSFVASRPCGARLTWGICRRDVRNALRPGDLVIFFATDRLKDCRPAPARYNFVGFATVQEKVSQTQIWQDKRLAAYRHYSNLLIRPSGKGFEHFESSLAPALWHGDWYWRLIETTKGSHREDFDAVQRRGRFAPQDPTVPAAVAANYVLFAPEGGETMILQAPPVVATAAVAGQAEAWRHDSFSRGLLKLLRSATDRSLRTSNVQRAHRHVTIQGCDPAEWRTRLRALCRSHGLRERTIHHGLSSMPAARGARRVC